MILKFDGVEGAETTSGRGVSITDDDGTPACAVREREDGSIYLSLPVAKIDTISESTLNLLLIPPMRSRRLPSNRKVEGE